MSNSDLYGKSDGSSRGRWTFDRSEQVDVPYRCMDSVHLDTYRPLLKDTFGHARCRYVVAITFKTGGNPDETSART